MKRVLLAIFSLIFCTGLVAQSNANAYCQSGINKYLLKDYRGAIADLTKAIEINRNHANAYCQRGLSKLELNQTDSGCIDLSKAGELGDSSAYEAIRKYCK